MTTTYHLKWLTIGRRGPHTHHPYPPTGQWTQPEPPALCESGWHACLWEHAIYHIERQLWIVELAGRTVEDHTKIAALKLRLIEQVHTINDTTLRMFAANCAEHVLHHFQTVHPDDPRPRETIQTARTHPQKPSPNHQQHPNNHQTWAWAAWRYAATTTPYNGKVAAAQTAAQAAAHTVDPNPSHAAWHASNTAAEAAAQAAAQAAYPGPADTAAAQKERAWQTDRLLIHYGKLDPTIFAHRNPQ